MPAGPKPTRTTYIVSVFEKPHWNYGDSAPFSFRRLSRLSDFTAFPVWLGSPIQKMASLPAGRPMLSRLCAVHRKPPLLARWAMRLTCTQ